MKLQKQKEIGKFFLLVVIPSYHINIIRLNQCDTFLKIMNISITDAEEKRRKYLGNISIKHICIN